VIGLDDPLLSEHLCVCSRLCDVLRPQAPIETNRAVQSLKIGVLGLVKARHERQFTSTRQKRHNSTLWYATRELPDQDLGVSCRTAPTP
jgi:hypothetical protein